MKIIPCPQDSQEMNMYKVTFEYGSGAPRALNKEDLDVMYNQWLNYGAISADIIDKMKDDVYKDRQRTTKDVTTHTGTMIRTYMVYGVDEADRLERLRATCEADQVVYVKANEKLLGEELCGYWYVIDDAGQPVPNL